MASTGTFDDTARRGVPSLLGRDDGGGDSIDWGLDDSLRTETSELTMDASSRLGVDRSSSSDEPGQAGGGGLDHSARSGGSSLGGASLGMVSTGTFGDAGRRGVGRHRGAPPAVGRDPAPSARGGGQNRLVTSSSHSRLVAEAVAVARESRRASIEANERDMSRRMTPCTSNLASSLDEFMGAHPGVGESPPGSPPGGLPPSGDGGPAGADGVAPVGPAGGILVPSSLDSKATLGMMSTGTEVDADRRGVARLAAREPPESLGAPASVPSDLPALLVGDVGGLAGLGSLTLSGSLGSKSTLGMASTGTEVDAARRGVARRRVPEGPGEYEGAPDWDDDVPDSASAGDFPFSLQSTGSLMDCTRRRVPQHGTSNQEWSSEGPDGEVPSGPFPRKTEALDGSRPRRADRAPARRPRTDHPQAADHERSLSEQTFVASNQSEASAGLREGPAANPGLTSPDLDPPEKPRRRRGRRPSPDGSGDSSDSLVRQMEILSRLHSGSPGVDEYVESSGRSLLRRRDRPGDAVSAPRRRGEGRDGDDGSGGSDLLQRYFLNKDRNRTPPPPLEEGPQARQIDGAAFHAERRELLERASVGDRVGTITVDRGGLSPGPAAPSDVGDESDLRVSELTSDFDAGIDVPDDLDGDHAHGVITVPVRRESDGGRRWVDRRVSDLTAATGFDDDLDGLEAELLESLGSHGIGGEDAESTILGGSLIRNMSKVTLLEHEEEDRDSESEMRRKDRE